MAEKMDDLYIAVLKHGRDNIETDITPTKLSELLKQDGYDFDPDSHPNAQLFMDTFKTPIHVGYTKIIPGRLKMEAYFRLLEHEELNDARQSSKEARMYATIAIAISIIAMLISTFFSYKQFVTPTKIDDSQFQQLIQPVSSEE